MESQPGQLGEEHAKYFVAIEGETYGPYTDKELVRYVEEHSIVIKDLAWREGLSDWTAVGTLLQEINPAPREGALLEGSARDEEPTRGKKPKSRLHKLTAETIRQPTKNGDLPLHRGAKNGTFKEIPPHLLTHELFLIQNKDGETVLHTAARSCNLHLIPPEYLTLDGLVLTDRWGRSVVHLAAEFGCLNQLPAEFLTTELLSTPTQNAHRDSVIHVAAEYSVLWQIPAELLTRSLLELRNALGETPLETLARNRATEKQLAFLRDLGVQVDGAHLTKRKASWLIEDALAGIKPTATLSTPPIAPLSVATAQSQSDIFTIVEFDQGTREWLEWRRNGVGASDAPAIMGENPWKNVAHLLCEKRGIHLDSNTSAAMARGTALEPEARTAYMERTGRVVHPACLQSNQYSWLRASVDGMTLSLDAVVEIKCGESAYRQTAELGRVPGYYYGQLQHILAVTGLPAIDFWCYLPGRSALLVPVERDDRYIERLLSTEMRFWMQVLGG